MTCSQIRIREIIVYHVYRIKIRDRQITGPRLEMFNIEIWKEIQVFGVVKGGVKYSNVHICVKKNLAESTTHLVSSERSSHGS
jgi:hypothetical protein